MLRLCFKFIVALAFLNISKTCKFYDNIETNYSFPFVRREEWHARSPRGTTPLHTPVPIVVIHHTSTSKDCYDMEACSAAMRGIQNYHMDEKGWWDIGYNFAVGSDGAVYEGRGWKLLGAQALHINDISIGITFIGNWTAKLPPVNQINTVKALIKAGVELGFVYSNYKLVGHRDVRDTQCPGDALYAQVQTWPQYWPIPYQKHKQEKKIHPRL